MNIINNNLIDLINDPYNDLLNYKIAYEYEKINQTASALSYYLRCSEFTKNNLNPGRLIAAPLKLVKCIKKVQAKPVG